MDGKTILSCFLAHQTMSVLDKEYRTQVCCLHRLLRSLQYILCVIETTDTIHADRLEDWNTGLNLGLQQLKSSRVQSQKLPFRYDGHQLTSEQTQLLEAQLKSSRPLIHSNWDARCKVWKLLIRKLKICVSVLVLSVQRELKLAMTEDKV